MTGLMFNKFRDFATRRWWNQEGDEIERRYIGEFQYHLDRAAKFVFTSELPFEDMQQFGSDLLQADAFALPFEVTYFQARMGGPHSHIFALFCIQLPAEPKYINVLQVYSTSSGMAGPLAYRFNVADKETAELPYPVPSPEAWDRSIGPAFSLLSTCVAFLSTKGTKHELISPTDGVNAKRARKGQRPIPEYTVVKIDPEIIKTYTAKGGTHASPRPHLRRGHVRRLDEERKTVVRPSFVNANGTLLPPPQYRVEKA